MTFIDTHTHCSDAAFRGEEDALIEGAVAAGVEMMLQADVDSRERGAMLALVKRHPTHLRAMLGLYPGSVDREWKREFDAVVEALRDEPAVALGEIGLDYHYGGEFRSEQMEAFHAQLELAASLDLPVNEETAGRARMTVAEAFGGTLPERFALIAPGARWETKKWPAEFFSAVIASVARREPGMRFLLAGSRDEMPDAETILAKCSGLPVVSICGKTSVTELLEAVRLSSLVICNDSGPMHMAAALGVPVVAMFGPTDPALTGPYCEKKSVFVPEIACIRCFLRYCKDSRCHASVDPEAVAAACSNLLPKRS